MAWKSAGVTSVISCAAAAVAQIAVPSGTSSLPQQWSPLACVLTSASIGVRSVTGFIAASMSRVKFRSKRVSTSSDAPSPASSPALLQPQPPSGWR